MTSKATPHGVGGRAPNKYRFRGEMMTIRQIATITGLNCKTVQKRIEKGIPCDRTLRKTPPLYIELRGQRLRPREIAAMAGVTVACVHRRHMRGEAVDAPPGPGEAYTPRGQDRGRVAHSSVFNDERPYIFDLRARHVMRYFQRAQPISTDDDIRTNPTVAAWVEELAGPGARLSDAGVAWLRNELRNELFVMRNLGPGETLEMLGDMEGVCRERVRQIEQTAMRSFRAQAIRLGVAAEVIRELRERDSLRRATWAETIEMEAPGTFGVFESDGRAA